MKLRSVTSWRTRDGNVRRIRLFEAWRNMIGRCNGGKSVDAGKYWTAGYVFGGWLHFREWALRSGYRKGLQLDRFRGSEPYSPNNCQWITAREHGKKSHATKHRTACACKRCRPSVKQNAGVDGVPF